MQRSARIRTEPIRYCYPFLEACTSGVTADTDNLGVSWRPGFFLLKSGPGRVSFVGPVPLLCTLLHVMELVVPCMNWMLILPDMEHQEPN